MTTFTATIEKTKDATPILVALTLAGCAATPNPSPNATPVVLTKDPAAVSKCQQVGEVHGNSLLGGIATSQGYENALADMKNQAAARGATHVLLMDVSSGHMGSNALGTAYRCN